jgi:hypothetical protein
MKNNNKIMLLLLILLGSTQVSHAQSDATMEDVEYFIKRNFTMQDSYWKNGESEYKTLYSDVSISIKDCDCKISYLSSSHGLEATKEDIEFSLSNISKTRSKISISDNEFSLDDKKLFELWIFSKENYKSIYRKYDSQGSESYLNPYWLLNTNKDLLERLLKAFLRGSELCQKKDKF